MKDIKHINLDLMCTAPHQLQHQEMPTQTPDLSPDFKSYCASLSIAQNPMSTKQMTKIHTQQEV